MFSLLLVSRAWSGCDAVDGSREVTGVERAAARTERDDRRHEADQGGRVIAAGEWHRDHGRAVSQPVEERDVQLPADAGQAHRRRVGGKRRERLVVALTRRRLRGTEREAEVSALPDLDDPVERPFLAQVLLAEVG